MSIFFFLNKLNTVIIFLASCQNLYDFLWNTKVNLKNVSQFVLFLSMQ